MMNPPADLKSTGLKVTLPRLKVLELFEHSSKQHLTAEEIYRMLMADDMDIGLATVYRVLTQFEQAGLLIRHHFDSDKAVYELNGGQHHDHLVCLQCGHLEEFFDEEIELRQKIIAAERGYTIHDHSLHLYVDCTKTPCPHRGTGK